MIRLEDVFVVFDRGEPLERTALREINLEIKLGDKISLIGNNGSGKSTLLRLLAGHISSSFGKIFLDKNNITDQPMNKRALDFTIVSPDYNINCFDNLTVIENLILASFITKEKMSLFEPAVSKARTEIVSGYLDKYDFLDLNDVLFSSVKDISYEQRQALCLMTVLMRPSAKILLIDDFAYGLKEDICSRLWTTLKQIITDNNLTAISVLDNPNYDANFFNRTIILSNGKIVLDATGEAKNNIDFSKIFSNFNIIPSLKNVVTKEVMLT